MIDRESLQQITEELGGGISRDCRPVSGGDSSDTWQLELSDDRVFLKTERLAAADRLSAEQDGLAAIAATDEIRVPRVLAAGETDRVAWLALEWLDLQAATPASDAELGQSLARLHRLPHEHFGWHRDNFIGKTQQVNTTGRDWVSFLAQDRLGYQLHLAKDKDSQLDKLGSQLLQRLPEFFVNHCPQASLLHGDLWSGNRAQVGSRPVIFDPAIYCGDREADLAMTQLFGGFHAEFYRAYSVEWGLDEGHARRADIYRLYHVLNHFNIFGGGYLSQAIALLTRVLRSSEEGNQ